MSTPTTKFVVMKVMPWSSLKDMDGKPLTVMTQAMGFMAVFSSLEELQAECPSAPYKEITMHVEERKEEPKND